MKKLISLIVSVLCVILAPSNTSAQNVTPDQIAAAKVPRVSNATKFYTLLTDTATGRFWYADVDSLKGRLDTVNISPNRTVTLNDRSRLVFLSSRFGTWQSGNGVTFSLPATPTHGQEIVITNQFGTIPQNTEFRFTATGAYSFRFPTGTQKIFAYDPLLVNGGAHVVFTLTECQFRCVANTIDKKWSCFVQTQ